MVERARAARVLGVDVDATPREVRDAYRLRARKVHPDVSGRDADAMAELNAAYEALRGSDGPNWDFVPSTSRPRDEWVDSRLLDDDQSTGERSLLRFFAIALVVMTLAATSVVFIAAIGYDWSLSP